MNPWPERRSGVAVETPVGAVLPYAGPLDDLTRTRLAVRGWLFCDGSLLTIAEYPELFAAVGRLYGYPAGEEGEGTFHLPDYRGAFLRGVNDGAHFSGGGLRDPDAADRTAAGPDQNGNQGDAVGSVQRDAFQGHEHSYQAAQSTAGTIQQGDKGGALAELTEDSTGIVEQDGAGAPRTSSETRPYNIYVNFIIKAARVVPEPPPELPARGGPEPA